MPQKRADLDGTRLRVPGHNETWLVFGGERHRISGSATIERLFENPKNVQTVEDLLAIEPGIPISDNAVLVQSDGTGGMFLVSGSPPIKTVKYYITSWESFVDFGFNQSQVMAVPKIVLDAIRSGPEIQSSKDRIDSRERFEKERA